MIYIYYKKGLFFETPCIRNLRVYTNALEGDVYHYRDKNGLSAMLCLFKGYGAG